MSAQGKVDDDASKIRARFQHFNDQRVPRGITLPTDIRSKAIDQVRRLEQSKLSEMVLEAQPDWSVLGPNSTAGRVKSIIVHPGDIAHKGQLRSVEAVQPFPIQAASATEVLQGRPVHQDQCVPGCSQHLQAGDVHFQYPVGMSVRLGRGVGAGQLGKFHGSDMGKFCVVHCGPNTRHSRTPQR